MDCWAFCSATSYKIKNLQEDLKSRWKTTLYRDALHVEIPISGGTADAFYFSYGALVVWGCPRDQALEFLEFTRDYEHQHSEETEADEFTYVYGEITKIIDDEITLPNHEVLTKLAISHGIAQSVKLGTFETSLQKTFNTTKKLPEDLAQKGKISLSRKEIRRKMGELFIERASINLHMDVLDTPEFFWEYPELEPYYKLMANYLDISPRVEVLNQRLDVVHGMFEMLGSELNHQHSSRLELTIICLIVIEVALALMRDVFRWI